MFQRTGFSHFITFLIFYLSLIAVADCRKNRIGRVCQGDGDCGQNEFCNIPKSYDPPCHKGFCACRTCFSNTTETSVCEPVHVERPCDLACSNGTKPYEGCDDWCENNPPLKALTPNSYCRHFNRGTRSRRVLCDACYESRNRQCVPKFELGNKFQCDEDCSCTSNLKCNGKCMCLTTNEHWDPVLLTCVRRELGDSCLMDRDCDVDAGDENFGGFYRGLACVNGRCRCAQNFTETDITMLDDNGAVVTRQICVINGAVIKLTEREKCNFKTIYDAKYTNTKMCAPGSLCMSCGDNPTKICRTVIPGGVKRAQTCDSSGDTNLVAVNSTLLSNELISGTESKTNMAKVGQACGRDGHCGPLEICYKTSVTPPCLEGACQCQDCHAVGPDKHCVQIEIMDLGMPCKNFKNVEIYPENSGCKNGIVECNMYYKQSGNKCVPDAARYGMPGDDCTSTVNCFGVLVCSASVTTSASMNKQPRQCGCQIGDNQRWDANLERCVGPKLGDFCNADSECTSMALLPPSAKSRICEDYRCTCKPFHMAYNGNCYSRDDQFSCPHCPEDAPEAPCRTAYVIEEDKSQELESCLSQRSAYLYKAENQNKVANCSQEPEPEKNKLGSPCFYNKECGPNEFCRKDDFVPICEYGRCSCKACHDIGPDDTCTPLTLMPLGAMCFDTPNEVYQQTIDDVHQAISPIHCNEGIVRCAPCYTLDVKSGRCVLKKDATKSEGELCESSCDCLGNGAMICGSDNRCACKKPSDLFDDTSRTCRPREIWTPCYSGANCNNSGFTIDGGICSNGFCACRGSYMATFTGFYDGANITSKQICVLSQAKSHLNRRLGASCIPEPLQHGSSLSQLQGGVCGSGLVCMNCDGDYDSQPARGICRKFADTRAPANLKSRDECAAALIRSFEKTASEVRAIVDNKKVSYTIKDVDLNGTVTRVNYSLFLLSVSILFHYYLS